MEDESYDEDGNLTPIGLAHWMDQEGGVYGLWMHSGMQPFIDAGVAPSVAQTWEAAQKSIETELERIGAVL